MNNITIENIIEQFEVELNNYEASKTTILNYINFLKKFTSDYNLKNASDLKQLEEYSFFAKFISKQKETNTNSTINYRLSTLSVFSKFLKRQGFISANTVSEVKKLPVENYVESLDDETIQRVLDSLKSRVYMEHKRHIDEVNAFREYLMVSMMITLGLRVNEVCSIQVGDIDMLGMTIGVRGKGYKGKISRVLDIPEVLYPLMTEWEAMRDDIDVHYDSKDYYFVSALTKKKIGRLSIEKRLHSLEDELGIEKLHPHLLRHSFASNNLHNERLSLNEVSNILGHERITTTEKYYISQNKKALKKTSTASNHFCL